MANRKGFVEELRSGNAVGAIFGLIVHLILMGLFLLLLGVTAPLLALLMPFVAYQLSPDSIGIFTFFYFFFGAFASAMFTFMVYCHVTRKERRARGETFGQHCRNVAGWPTLSIIGSWAADLVFLTMFHEWLWISEASRFIFFTLAPVAVFAPLWVYLIHRKRQKEAQQREKLEWEQRSAAWDAAHEEEETLWQKMQDDDRRRKDAEFLRSQGIVN